MQSLHPTKLNSMDNTYNDTTNFIDHKKLLNQQYHASNLAQSNLQSQPNKVKSTLERFDLMHQQTKDDDNDDDDDPMYNKPLFQSFNPPETVSISNQQKMRTENNQIMSARMQNLPMGMDQHSKYSSASLSTKPTMGSISSPYQQDGFTLMPSSVPVSTSNYNNGNEPTNNNGMMQQNSNEIGTSYYTPQKMQDLDLGKYDLQPGEPKSHELYVKQMNGGGVGASSLNGYSKLSQSQKYNYLMPKINNINVNDNDLLLKKINYMIHLLEEQKDEKTDSATEDIILYSFLGVFMIFIVDSFSRVGRYIR